MRKNKVLISLCLVVVLVLSGACTQNEVEQLEGILQNVDAANGEITVVTKDGQTVTLKIDTEASVEAEGASSTLETLEVGASIQVEVNEDNQVVQHIKAQQTEIEGEIVRIVGDKVTVESEDGERVTILVSDDTRIESEADSPGTPSTLQVGDKIETTFDPESKTAFSISGQEEEVQQAEADNGPDKEEESETGSVTVSEEEAVKPDIEPDVEDKPDVEPDVETDRGRDIIGDATPDGDVDIDGDGKITIVDVVGGLEAERARLAEAIAENRISGYYDAEWIRNAEAERQRLAEEIERALSDDTYIVVIDGRWVIMDIEPTEVIPDPEIDHLDDDGHPDDGEGDHTD